MRVWLLLSKPSEWIMDWQAYVVSITGSFAILGLCYLMGRYEYSFIWIFFLVILNGLKSYMWRKREKRLLSLRQTALREREVIMAQLQDLPAWVQFPDTERVEWLNKVILQLWPYIGEYSKHFLCEYIEPQVKLQLPGVLKSFRFTRIDMGDIPCRVGGLKVYTHNVGRDRIIIDADVAYAGDAEFDVTVAGFTGGLDQLQCSGKLRVMLKPLLPYPPMIGGISGSFLEKPRFDFNLTGLGELVDWPILMSAIRSIIDSQVSDICVVPNEIVISLVPDLDVIKLLFPEPDGVLRLVVVEACNLEDKDSASKSDPYCAVHVGSQYSKSRTIDNNLNPIWNDYFEFVVDFADGQKLRIECFDEDIASKDDELGWLIVNLSSIRKEGFMDRWFPLEGCKHGDIRIQTTWMDLSSSMSDLICQDRSSQQIGMGKPVHSALLMLYIDTVSDLPYTRKGTEPSPYITVTFGNEVQQTPVKMKTVNPLFQSKFLFFVRRAEGQELKLQGFDNTTKRSLGECILPLEGILQEPNLEIIQQTVALTLGAHQSPMVITARIRALVPVKTMRDSSDPVPDANEAAQYANEVFIERAERSYIDGSSQRKYSVDRQKRISPIVSSGKQVSSKAATAGAVTVVEPTVPFNELLAVRLNSDESVNSTWRKRNVWDRLLQPKHAQSMERIAGPQGRLKIALRFVEDSNKLIVSVVRIEDLKPLDLKGLADPYVVVKLVTTGISKSIEKRRTAIIQKSLNPVFNDQFAFYMHVSDKGHRKLVFIVKDATNYGVFSRAPILGLAELALEMVDISNNFALLWLDLDISQ